MAAGGLSEAYPRVVIDIELYRPRTGKGRSGFFTGRLIAVGIGIQRGRGDARVEVLALDRGGEGVLVRRVVRLLEGMAGKGRGVLGGYNILSLDLPVILSKAHELLGREWGRRAANILYRRFLVVDLFQHALQVYRGPGLPSFSWYYEWLACRHGLPVPGKASGYSVHDLYESGRMEEIIGYSRLDAALHLIALAAFLGDPGAPVLAEKLGVGGVRCARAPQPT